MKIIIKLLATFLPMLFFTQNSNDWFVFYNSDSTKIGYKNAAGEIQIEPKFQSDIADKIFKNVIAVIENDSKNNWKNYFLNKQGKIFGENEIYLAGTNDFAEDSQEYDGIIKFRNSKGVGYYDYNGKIVIQPIYNDLTNFHNGIARGLRGAIWPKCIPEKEDCEHIWWQGGQVFAINTKGEELFELPNIYSTKIDYNHPIINSKVESDVHISYSGKDGKVYSFLEPEKDFDKWFKTVFIPDFKKNKTVLPKYFYDLISVDDNNNPMEQTAWKNYPKKEYLAVKKNDRQNI